MITAALSAAVLGVLAFFGISLSAAKITGVVVGAKIVVVLSILAIGWKVKRRRDAKAALGEQGK
jgi:hypothetical protein